MKFCSKKALLAASVTVALAGCNSSSDDKTVEAPLHINLRLMETTDLHGAMMPYDYFANAGGQNYGFARTAVVIRETRDEVANSMLFDNGDLIQGSPMADYVANIGVEYFEHDIHPVFKAMNLLDYDAANIGNHEFNYGLEYMDAALEGANFPYVVSNVFEYDESLVENGTFGNSCELTMSTDMIAQAGDPIYPAWVPLERSFVASNGEEYTLNIGVIGFTPPNIMSWDKSHLECEVLVTDIKTTAEYWVPQMKAAGMDVIVAVPHSGLANSDQERPFQENATWQLAQVEGIDAIMFGHDHNNFPTTSNTYDGMEGVEPSKGKIFGKPAVMPGSWGDHLGIIDLVIETLDEGETWEVNYGKSTASLRALNENPNETDIEVVIAVSGDHLGTVEYMQEELVEINQEINSFFSALEPDLSVQIVNEAQFNWGLQQEEEGLLEMEEDAILLSVSAPFKGGRNGNDDYTNINGTHLTNASIADLYVFDNNTPAVLKLTVADVKEWLETIASQQYQTVEAEGQRLLHQMFRSYNFDVFYGGWDNEGQANTLNYTIDVSQGPRYAVDEIGDLIKENGELVKNEDNYRIGDIMYNGKALDNEQVLYVVTNNYRASNDDIPGVDNAEIVLEDAAFTNRELVDQYIKQLAEAADGDVPLVEFDNANNFELLGPQGITAEFLSDPRGKDFAESLDNVTYTEDRDSVGDNHGYAVYQYTFN
ncbi:bifunctional 2',3'-cyclic-nucleotide 2'-phosphodiesterase/3'-nucleotidase [Vibrio sp. WXL210]|uniref:bifunctional 2',3'-cyclic-nucleotide 2'-phosphodiesterase/3'-nucleotidase n=1 Tax=Vibrio sp. WXL210 TaxID=3450709 RepID=UPI003EC7ADA0